MLIRNIDRLKTNRHTLKDSFEHHQVFKRIQDLGHNHLIFLQFPFGQTKLDILSKLKEHDQELLLQCLEIVYGKRDPNGGIGFAFEESRKSIPFPDYTELFRLGVVQKTISLLERICDEEFVREGAKIDPEVVAVLAEMPRDRNWGLNDLQGAIIEAFYSFSLEHKNDKDKLVQPSHFKEDKVQIYFDSPHGAVVRCRWLYQHLEDGGSRKEGRQFEDAGPAQRKNEGKDALAGLEAVLDLFCRLDRLQNREKPPTLEEIRIRSVPEILEYQKIALDKVFDFFQELFGSPHKLQQRIEKFRPVAASNGWRSQYPGDDIWKEARQIAFTWPYEFLPLHSAVYQFFKLNDVTAEIHPKRGRSLERYDDLKRRRDRTKEERAEIDSLLDEREDQRKEAEKFVQTSHAQPVFGLLDPTHKQNIFFRTPSNHC